MKNFIFLYLLLWVQVGFCQTLTVYDLSSLQPIVGAEIKETSGSSLGKTDAKGQFIFKAEVTTAFIIFHPDYRPLTVSPEEYEKSGGKIYLAQQEFRLEEIVVSSSRFQEKKEDVAQQVDVLNSRELEFKNAQTSGDALTETGNVFLQKSQMGGGSPILRGFEANKVLIVVDGIRMNNAIYRGGHLQNVIRLDNNMLDRVEVVYGPSSTVYGSDALGGVMHFHTRRVHFSSDDKVLSKGGVLTRYSTANEEKTGSFWVNVANKKWGMMLTGTYSDFGDLRQGNLRDPRNGDLWKRLYYADRMNGKDTMIKNSDPNIQVGSGYSQYNVIGKIGFRPNEKQLHVLSFHYTTSSNVNRYDRLQEYSGSNLRFAEWYYGPEKQMITAYQGKFFKPTAIYDLMQITLAWQSIEESRINRRFNNNSRRYQEEQVEAYSANIDFSKSIAKHEIRYGAEFVFNDVKSTGYAKNIVTETESPFNSRYPDGKNSMRNAAVFVTHNWEINEKLVLTDGLRFSSIGLNANFIDTSIMHFPYTTVAQNNNALTGSLGLIAKLKQGWRIALLGSTGFRSPNIDDLGKVFDSQPGLLIVPNPDLKPEYTHNVDLTIEKSFADRVRIGFTGYYTAIKDLITTKPYSFNGADSINYNGIPSRIVASQNSLNGFVYGFSANLTADITDHFSVVSTLNYTKGRINTDSTAYPLDHIPPMFGRSSFRFKTKKFMGEFFLVYSAWKRLKDYNMLGEDNFPAATPQGMPSWCTLNVRASYQFNRFVRLQAGIENITDLNYRLFASNISAPGRNLFVAVRFNF